MVAFCCACRGGAGSEKEKRAGWGRGGRWWLNPQSPLWSDRLTPVYLSYCHSPMVWGGIQMVGVGLA